ncbi:hypothetical protein FGG78_30465 [Thioclava sp. BHET1]|nr:hypothetical protein FGG78_30465 [Thioclava sp. BHET1]
MRSTNSTMTFYHPFFLPGYTDELPAGDYDVIVQEELLEGLSFAAYRRIATYLTVPGKGRMTGRVELRPTSERDLETARGLNQTLATRNSVTPLSPSEDSK